MILVYLVALVSGIISGIGEIFNKNITEDKFSVYSYAFIQWAGAVVFYAIPFFLWGSFPKEFMAYVYLGIIISVVLIGNLALIKAYKTEDISNINILSQVSLVVSFLMGTVLLHEPVNIYKISGLILIIFGVIVIFYEKRKIHLSIAYLLSLIAGISFGITGYFNKLTLVYINPVSLLFIYNLVESICLLFLPKTLKDVKPILQKYKWKVLTSRLCIVIGLFFFIWSIERGNISVVMTNYQISFLLSAVIIGIIFLKEKSNIAKKLAGSLLCVLGIILLNFF